MSSSAGALGIEPRFSVLETEVLPLNDAPYHYLMSYQADAPVGSPTLQGVGAERCPPRQKPRLELVESLLLCCKFYFLNRGMRSAHLTKLFIFQLLRDQLLILGAIINSLLTLLALQLDKVIL